MNAPLTLVTDPVPAAWSALARALDAESGALVAVRADLRADLSHDDPQADVLALIEGRGRLAGPLSGGAVTGDGHVALVSRVGAAFTRLVAGVAIAEAVDLGLGWDLDEADLVERWSARPTISCIALAAPRPSSRLACALRDLEGRVQVIVLDATGRRWEALGAATVMSFESLRLALSLPPSPQRVTLVGNDGAALDGLADALEAQGFTVVPPSPGNIAEEAHTRVAIERVVDLLGVATARHARVAIEAQREAVIVHGLEAPSAIGCAAGTDPWVFATALRARAHTSRAAEALPVPQVDLERAQAVLMAALVMRRRTLTRDESIAFVCAMGMGRAAPSLQVASAPAARHAGERLGWPLLLGAPGASAHEVTPDTIDGTWQVIARELEGAANVDPWAARWVAALPAEPRLHLDIHGAGRNDVGPVGHWRIGATSARGTLPLRRGDADGPDALLGAASLLVRAIADLERVSLTGTWGPSGATIVDAHVQLRAV